jgi:hypothetical protein
VRVGCEWMPVKGGTARGVEHRDPTGRRLLVQRGIEDQCAERLDVVVIRGPKAVPVFTANASREDMVRSGVCSDLVRVELIEQDCVLLGFQTLSRTDESAPWTVVEERRFRGQGLVVVAPSSPSCQTPEPARTAGTRSAVIRSTTLQSASRRRKIALPSGSNEGWRGSTR